MQVATARKTGQGCVDGLPSLPLSSPLEVLFELLELSDWLLELSLLESPLEVELLEEELDFLGIIRL